MEKYSAYRDPGTGIQPFLTPVPPQGSELLAKITFPFACILGAIRTALVLVLLLVYLVLVRGLCLLFAPVPPVHRSVTYFLTAIISRTALLAVGLFWIQIEHVTRKRGRTTQIKESWNPKAGDIIVSNWASWIELLWLAFRFNPIFVVPVSESPVISLTQSSTPISGRPGRGMGTGSANISSPSKAGTVRIPIVGFQEVSLLAAIHRTGAIPSSDSSQARALEDIRKSANRPIVVFPECTTSNGRGMLRFADVFQQKVPVTRYRVFVMCVRYDPPTVLTPTLTLSIPTAPSNPLRHLFSVASSISPPPMTVRLLAPSESPSSPLFMASEFITSPVQDELSEACAALIAQLGKMKRTGMGWEDKGKFLEFYRGKRKL